jgi:hypothetical protein
MFIGHFAVAFAAKRLAPRVSLGSAFFAAQFLDLLWPTLLLLRVETVRLAPPGAPVPLLFEHYPVSHSLVAAIGWGVLVAALHLAWRRSIRAALVLGLLVASHWLLDWLVHLPDLPLAPGGATRVGLGLWEHKVLALVLELALFAWGVALYARSTRPLARGPSPAFIGLVLFLLAIQAGNVFGPAPDDVRAVAWVGQAQWLLVAWAWWIDRRRIPVAA